jgi:DNA (cytosine-5)-methyltransferase 1
MLVLSLFPGIGLLDMAFEAEGFCVVRGPDLLWGGDVRRFRPPAGKFDGVIGGPPCQAFSSLRTLNPLAGQKHGNLIPEFERVVEEARPLWFLMENVRPAPVPQVRWYWPARNVVLNPRWLGYAQNRERRFSFATRQDVTPSGITLDVSVDIVLLESPDYAPTVLAGHGPVGRGKGYDSNPTLAEMCERQGLPGDFLEDSPFTVNGKRGVIGNGVPLPLGRAVARAVRRALESLESQPEHRGVVNG